MLFTQGYLINSVESGPSVVPVMSPYMLRHYIGQSKSHLDPRIIESLKQILSLQDTDTSASDPMTGHPSEKFHAYFEALRSLLLDGKTLTVGDLFPGCLVNPQCSELLARRIVMHARSIDFLKKQVRSVSASYTAAHGSEILVPCPNNPGFDILIPACLGDNSEKSSLFVEIRYSDVNSTTVQSATQIADKHRLIEKACTSEVPGLCRPCF